MIDVFLSYSSADIGRANKLVGALESAGLTVFWDQATPPGVDWDTWIRAKLSDSRSVVVLWSKTSVASANVRHEAIIARDQGKLIPVLLEAVDPKDFPMGLYLVQGLKLSDWNGETTSEAFHRLLEHLGTKQALPPESSALKVDTRGRARRRLAILTILALWLLGAIGTAEFMGWPPQQPRPLVVGPHSCSDAPRDNSVDAYFDAQRPCSASEAAQLRVNHEGEIAGWEREQQSYWTEVAFLMLGVLVAPLVLCLVIWMLMCAWRWLLRTVKAANSA